MDSDRDDVLSLNDDREDSGDFSGFSSLNSPKQSTSKEKEKRRKIKQSPLLLIIKL